MALGEVEMWALPRPQRGEDRGRERMERPERQGQATTTISDSKNRGESPESWGRLQCLREPSSVIQKPAEGWARPGWSLCWAQEPGQGPAPRPEARRSCGPVF